MCPAKSWEELNDIDRKILTLAGRTPADVAEAYRNWTGTTYPYRILIKGEWIRFRLTQQQVEDLWSYAERIVNIGSVGVKIEDVPESENTVENLKVVDGRLIYVSTVKGVDDVEKVFAEKLLELEERIEALEGE
jgi:hypothetical protein